MKNDKVVTIHDDKGKAVGVTTAKAIAKAPVNAKPAPKKKPEAKKPVEKKDAKPAPEIKLSFQREAFQQAVNIAADFAEKKAALHVLTHILIDSDGAGHCRIAATDLEVSWSKIILCKGPKAAHCIPAALLTKEVKALPSTETEVVISFKDRIATMNGRCKIYCIGTEEFPAFPSVKGWTEMQIDDLHTGLQRVSAAMGNGDSRYTLNGVLFDIEKRKVVATDGHRLHFEEIGIRGEAKKKAIIIPRKAVMLMVKHPMSETPKLTRLKGSGTADSIAKSIKYELDIFGHKVKVEYEPHVSGKSLVYANATISGPVSETGSKHEFLDIKELQSKVKSGVTLKDYLYGIVEGLYLSYHKTVGITLSDERMTYPAAGGEMIIRLVEGNYPQYENVIPKKNPIAVEFNADDFLQNMEGALPLTHDDFAVSLKVNGSLMIETSSPERGTYKHQIACKVSGKDKGDVLIKLNARFLIAAIKAYAKGKTLLEMKAPEKPEDGKTSIFPCVINKKAVIMPMK